MAKGWESEVKGAGREIERGIGRRGKRRLRKVRRGKGVKGRGVKARDGE